MNLHQFYKGKAIGFLVVLTLVGIFYAFNSYIYYEKQGNSEIPTPQRMTLSGKYVCLPHKDTSGPQTKECAIGLHADNGFYYALDFNLMSQTLPKLTPGERITASGVFTPIEYLSSDHWQKYNVVGIFSVTDSVKKN